MLSKQDKKELDSLFSNIILDGVMFEHGSIDAATMIDNIATRIRNYSNSKGI